MKINNLDDLLKLKEQMKNRMAPRMAPVSANEDGSYPVDLARDVVICAGSGCASCGCLDIASALKSALADHSDKVRVILSGCIGLCAQGPIAIVYPEDLLYTHVELSDVPELVESHLLGGKPVTRLLYKDHAHKNVRIPLMKDVPFFSGQENLVFKKRGLICAESIDEYVAWDGYQALSRVLTDMQPLEVCDTIERSGLRGRGGAGFPTGTKWRFCLNAASEQKYLICNADEGDPGAFMDRSVLESDPHAVIEGMMIGGYAIGASKGFVYVRAEYPLAISRLSIAIEKARACGLLGTKILGSEFAFDIEIRMGFGAFVCGEETALMNSIEGRRGEPRLRPPYPAQKGLWGKPSNINNVETLATIPWIIQHGSEAFASIGSEKSKGTKIFALAGDVVNTGLVEVPMGTTLRQIVMDIGGGVPGKHKTFKAAQLGGPSGGCLPAEHLDSPIDYESLPALGAMMGSGGLIVMNNDTCMVDVARFFMEFVQDESCGKCVPCRVGTKRMLEALTRITTGDGVDGDIEKLLEMSEDIINTSLCGLGKTAPNPIISTIRYFRHEYEEHILNKECRSGICKPLFHFKICTEKCSGCTVCAKKCPTNCISGERKAVHDIEQSECIKCNECYRVCKFNAVLKVGGAYKPATES